MLLTVSFVSGRSQNVEKISDLSCLTKPPCQLGRSFLGEGLLFFALCFPNFAYYSCRIIKCYSLSHKNTLFPVFLKLERLDLLMVGGGAIGLEKLNTVIDNSPSTQITIVAKEIRDEIKEIAARFPNIRLIKKPYEPSDLQGQRLVIAAVNDLELAHRIVADCNRQGLLVNAADKPDICDFYLGSVVRKGNLKLAISTNGTSPTVAKRLREMLTDVIPDEMDALLDNMKAYRSTLKGDFEKKVSLLNEHTQTLTAKQLRHEPNRAGRIFWQEVVKYCLVSFFSIIVGYALFSYFPLRTIWAGIAGIPALIDLRSFGLMTLAGFLAQMADGSLGMGYGTISTTFLLAIGVNPAVVSSRVHSARVFSSGVSGYSHHRFGNINKKLFAALVLPGVLGAVLGAALAVQAKDYAVFVRIPLSLYTVYLGYYIIQKAYKKKLVQEKTRNVGWLASIGGFMDAFAGGGWGALVTSTLVAKRRNARYVIGSVCLAEFFVVFSSAFTFLILLRHIPLLDVLGLIFGGVVAAPIAARLAGKLPVKKVLIGVGLLVICTSLNTLVKSGLALLKLWHH